MHCGAIVWPKVRGMPSANGNTPRTGAQNGMLQQPGKLPLTPASAPWPRMVAGWEELDLVPAAAVNVNGTRRRPRRFWLRFSRPLRALRSLPFWGLSPGRKWPSLKARSFANDHENQGFQGSPSEPCALSSVVEHFLHTEGVAGSSPAARTIFSLNLPEEGQPNPLGH